MVPENEWRPENSGRRGQLRQSNLSRRLRSFPVETTAPHWCESWHRKGLILRDEDGPRRGRRGRGRPWPWHRIVMRHFTARIIPNINTGAHLTYCLPLRSTSSLSAERASRRVDMPQFVSSAASVHLIEWRTRRRFAPHLLAASWSRSDAPESAPHRVFGMAGRWSTAA